MKLLIALALIVVAVSGCSPREELYYVDTCSGYAIVKNEVRDFDSVVVYCSSYQEARAECDRLNKEASDE